MGTLVGSGAGAVLTGPWLGASSASPGSGAGWQWRPSGAAVLDASSSHAEWGVGRPLSTAVPSGIAYSFALPSRNLGGSLSWDSVPATTLLTSLVFINETAPTPAQVADACALPTPTPTPSPAPIIIPPPVATTPSPAPSPALSPPSTSSPAPVVVPLPGGAVVVGGGSETTSTGDGNGNAAVNGTALLLPPGEVDAGVIAGAAVGAAVGAALLIAAGVCCVRRGCCGAGAAGSPQGFKVLPPPAGVPEGSGSGRFYSRADVAEGAAPPPAAGSSPTSTRRLGALAQYRAKHRDHPAAHPHPHAGAVTVTVDSPAGLRSMSSKRTQSGRFPSGSPRSPSSRHVSGGTSSFPPSPSPGTGASSRFPTLRSPSVSLRTPSSSAATPSIRSLRAPSSSLRSASSRRHGGGHASLDSAPAPVQPMLELEPLPSSGRVPPHVFASFSMPTPEQVPHLHDEGDRAAWDSYYRTPAFREWLAARELEADVATHAGEPGAVTMQRPHAPVTDADAADIDAAIEDDADVDDYMDDDEPVPGSATAVRSKAAPGARAIGGKRHLPRGQRPAPPPPGPAAASIVLSGQGKVKGEVVLKETVVLRKVARVKVILLHDDRDVTEAHSASGSGTGTGRQIPLCFRNGCSRKNRQCRLF